MTEKQQQLLFDKGITNVPSDALCSDNTLAESVGMIYDNGEHRVIQKPADFITEARVESGGTVITMNPGTLIYVHKFNDQERYIGYSSSGSPAVYKLYWGTLNDTTWNIVGALKEDPEASPMTFDKIPGVTSIGKTLVISDDKGVHYFLWTKDSNNNDTYDWLGDSFPRPIVNFRFRSQPLTIATARCDDMVSDYSINPGKQTDWNDAIVGLYSQIRNKIRRKKCFLGSFCVRVALELYDGSYYHISNPILLINQISAIAVASISYDEEVQMQIPSQYLEYQLLEDYSKWTDIIKDVVVFATEEAPIFDTISDAILEKASMSSYLGEPYCYRMELNSIVPDSHTFTEGFVRVLESVPDADIEDVVKEGVYYKLCSLGVTKTASYNSLPIQTHTLENLTTQERLDYDDFYSLCPFKANVMYDYNSRLNLADVSRGFFEGYDYFMPFDQGTQYPYVFYVTIGTDIGDIVVSHSAALYQKQGIYFYYPDSRAKKVVITKNGNIIRNRVLKEHPSLNGAYFLGTISPDMTEPGSETGNIPQVTPGPPFEQLPNYVMTSEVNNPYVFKAEGYHKVGTGRIVGLSSITTALSQGQFGQYPLIVFSEDGIWAMSVNSEGLFTASHPMSREVCNNAKSITQTDGAVFFTSEKGLMVVVGSQVKCVSEQLLGREDPFAASKYQSSRLGSTNAFFRNCHIAYDYRDSLLWLFSNSAAASCCYVYSIRSGTFGKFQMATTLNAVNNYPDYLIQVPSQNNKVYSLLNRPSIDSDTKTYAAKMLSRPMKLENALALKTLMQVEHIKDFKPYTVTDNGTETTAVAALEFHIYASNNLNDWVELSSLTGLPWKYYRFGYEFSGLKAVDRFSGTIAVTQERRTEKLR